jgi:hypothetical protein
VERDFGYRDHFPMDSLVQNLKLLKSLVIGWERNKKQLAKEELTQLEADLDILYTDFPGGFEKDEEKVIGFRERKKETGTFKAGGGNLETKEQDQLACVERHEY